MAVNLIGWPGVESGIGEDIRVAARSLKEVGIPFAVVDAYERVPPSLPQTNNELAAFMSDKPVYPIDIVFLDAAAQYKYYSFDRIKNRPIDRKIILVSPWELPKWPPEIAFALEGVDGFWAATQYIHEAFRPYFPRRRIMVAPPAVIVPEEEMDRFDITVSHDPFYFLTIFDGLSSIHRKNPMAVVRAFQAAFPDNSKVRLIVKMMNMTGSNLAFQELMNAISADNRIEVINQTLTRLELFALVKRAHCFVSLHRSEGFGRNIAESMWFGRPVICSDYSGNSDFCGPKTAYLVKGKKIQVNPLHYAYSKGQKWFDADHEEAARHMRDIYENRAKAAAIAMKGQKLIRSFHCAKSTGERYRKLLNSM